MQANQRRVHTEQANDGRYNMRGGYLNTNLYARKHEDEYDLNQLPDEPDDQYDMGLNAKNDYNDNDEIAAPAQA